MLCRLFRFMISSAADSGGPVGPMTDRHIAHCEECRQFLRTCEQIAEGLQSEAGEWEGRSGPLHRRLALNVTRTAGQGRGSLIRVTLAVAACLAVVAGVTLSLTMPARPPRAPATTVTVAMPTDVRWAASWIELMQTPLAAEAENLTSDAESGIRFLAACLDVRPLGGDTSTRPGDDATPSLR